MKNILKYLNIFKINSTDSTLKFILITVGLTCCIAACGIAGLAIQGALGASFGILLGYVFGRLVLI